MNYEMVIEKLKNSTRFKIVEEKTNGQTKQIKLNNGEIINWFKNGNHNVQGKNQQEEKDVLDGRSNSVARKVFVVYGHDEISRTQLEALL